MHLSFQQLYFLLPNRRFVVSLLYRRFFQRPNPNRMSTIHGSDNPSEPYPLVRSLTSQGIKSSSGHEESDLEGGHD